MKREETTLQDRILAFLPKMEREINRIGDEVEITLPFGDFEVAFVHHYDETTVKNEDDPFARTTYVWSDEIEVLDVYFTETEDSMPNLRQMFNKVITNNRVYDRRIDWRAR